LFNNPKKRSRRVTGVPPEIGEAQALQLYADPARVQAGAQAAGQAPGMTFLR
jgi:hypothetical protein